jgi:hypothetical protein
MKLNNLILNKLYESSCHIIGNCTFWLPNFNEEPICWQSFCQKNSTSWELHDNTKFYHIFVQNLSKITIFNPNLDFALNFLYVKDLIHNLVLDKFYHTTSRVVCWELYNLVTKF